MGSELKDAARGRTLARRSSDRRRGAAPRTLALALGVVIAGAVLLVFTLRGRSRAAIDELPPTADELRALLADRVARPPEPLRLTRPGAPRRLAISEDVVSKLYPMVKRDNHEYDPFSLLRRESNLDVEKPWPEHPDGRWLLKTNSVGMREDSEVATTKRDLRILVTGDSHTEGMCNNKESFANLLEAALQVAHSGKTVEVLNAAKVGYSFFNYRGVLERFADLAPDVFLVAVYGGNDFEESLTIAHYLSGVPRPPGKELYMDKIEAARKINWPCMSQGLVACKYFQANPAEMDLAVDVALALAGDIVGQCEARGIAPMFVYIPPPYEVARNETYDALIAAVELGPADLDRFRVMGDRFLMGLASMRVPALDMRPAFNAYGKPLYWEQDHHLNLAGQALIAAELEPIVEPLLSESR